MTSLIGLTPCAALNASLSSFSIGGPVRLPTMERPPKIRSELDAVMIHSRAAGQESVTQLRPARRASALRPSSRPSTGDRCRLEPTVGLGVEIAEIQHREHHHQHQTPAVGELHVFEETARRRPVPEKPTVCTHEPVDRQPRSPVAEHRVRQHHRHQEREQHHRVVALAQVTSTRNDVISSTPEDVAIQNNGSRVPVVAGTAATATTPRARQRQCAATGSARSAGRSRGRCPRSSC